MTMTISSAFERSFNSVGTAAPPSFRRNLAPLGARRGSDGLPRADVAVLGEPPAGLAVGLGLLRRPRGEPVDVAVVHAERRRDEHGVVDLVVGRTLAARALDVL